MPELAKLPFPGAVDADGHILEPPDLWTRYLEPRYRERALRIRKDERGLEYLEIDGKPSKLVAHGMPAGLGAMDAIGGIQVEREKTGLAYVDNASLGAMDAAERLQRLDLEGLDRAFLYPTLGVLWECECEDLDLAQAYIARTTAGSSISVRTRRADCSRSPSSPSGFPRRRRRSCGARRRTASAASGSRPLS